MLSVAPFAARFRRKLGRGSVRDRAEERIELSPAITSDRAPALCLPGEFDRARQFYESREMERGRIEGGRREEGATIAYLVRDAVVAHGAVYKGWAGEFYRNDAPRAVLTGRPEHRGEGLLATSQMSELYFGDWLVESASLGLIASERSVPPVAFARKPWLHEPGYQAMLGIAAEPIFFARFDRLWLVDDRGMNTDRERRFRETRRRLRAHASGAQSPDRVFLARGNLGQAREVANGEALAEFLAARGYTVVHPEQETVADLVRKLAHAESVVTVEGSAQVHALLAMPERSTLTILQPPLRFTAPGKDMADLAGIRYAFLVGDPVEDAFAVDTDRLGALLDQNEAVPS